MWEHIGPLAAIAALILSLVTVGIGAVLKFSLSRMETGMGEMELKLRTAITDAGKEIDERIDRQGREFGETVLAMRQKIQEVELYVRDEYVSKSTFVTVTSKIDKQIEDTVKRIEKKLDQIEAKA